MIFNILRRLFFAYLFFVFSVSSAFAVSCGPSEHADLLQLSGRSFDLKLENYLTDWGIITPSEGPIAAQLLPFLRLWTADNRPLTADDDIGNLAHLIRPSPVLRGDHVEILNFPPQPAEGSSLYPIWAYINARSLVWLLIEWSPILTDAAKRQAGLSDARDFLMCAAISFPGNVTISQYLGQQLYWGVPDLPENSAAPEWASLQIEGLSRLREIAKWWVTNRQAQNGAFGGGLQDDVEMWRWWAPLVIARDDPLFVDAQHKLISLVLRRGDMESGYTSNSLDVEHSAENSVDTLVPALLMDLPIATTYLNRFQNTLRDKLLFRCRTDGSLRFPSVYLPPRPSNTSGQADADGQVPYHALLFMPMLTADWLGISDADDYYVDWLAPWIESIFSSANGKPNGLPPAVLECRDHVKAKNSYVVSWYHPFPNSSELSLYNWGGGEGLISLYAMLINVFEKTGDKIYLSAVPFNFRGGVVVFSSEFDEIKEAGQVKAVLQSAASVLGRRYKLAQEEVADPDLESDITGHESDALTELSFAIRPFRYNYEMYTYENRWTDRIIDFDGNYVRFLQGRPYVAKKMPDILYSMMTGDAGPVDLFPQPRLRWHNLNNIAVRVNFSTNYFLGAQLFSFESAERKISATINGFSEGDYCSTVSDLISKRIIDVRGVYFDRGRNIVPLSIPAGKLLSWKIRPGLCG